MAKLVILLAVQLFSVLLFCTGFFPSKVVLEGNGEFLHDVELQKSFEPVFNKFVLIVIDALRSDFVFENGSQFHYLHSKLNDGSAWGFTAYSNPPTVTLPRLKGITTGSTPNFVDAILNVAEDDSSSSLKTQDSWLMQFHRQNKKIRFYGDDTWLKLFPLNIFDSYEGTNSFFVSDFEQVDHNVTRHISSQLKRKNDWDVLILHYLGLDHIGHKGGAYSKFMPSKQNEMDLVIKNIYEEFSDDDQTLICIMGDHGMNNLGNHGGSSAGETSAALTFLSKKLEKLRKPLAQVDAVLPISIDTIDEDDNEKSYNYLTSMKQIDLVPTLATLFNVPIPKNSVGVIMPDMLSLMDPQLAKIKLRDNFKMLIELSNKQEDIVSFETTNFEVESVDAIIKKMIDIQNNLMQSATNYNMPYMYAGCLLLFLSGIASFYVLYSKVQIVSLPSILIVSLSLLIGISSFGSSFVEEEHQIWWWVMTGFLIWLVTNKEIGKFTFFTMLVMVRLIRGWNDSGQKFIYEYTIAKLLSNKFAAYQWWINILTISFVAFNGSFETLFSFVTSTVLGVTCILYKLCWSIENKDEVPFVLQNFIKWIQTHHLFISMTHHNESLLDQGLVFLAQLFFTLSVACFAMRLALTKLGFKKNAVNDLRKYIKLVLLLQTSPNNIGMFFVFEILEYYLREIIIEHFNRDNHLTSIISLAMQYFTFFQMGGTNSIATINLSNAYHGVSQNYNIYFVGFMMCSSNFASAIYWAMFPWTVIYQNGGKKWAVFANNKLPVILFNCVAGFLLLIACIALRFHLFIWSVFSPKLCYYATWNIFMNLIIGWIVEATVISAI